jgi:hypothetical protein
VVCGSLSEKRFLLGHEQSKEHWQQLPTGKSIVEIKVTEAYVRSNRLWNFLLAFFTPFIASSIQFRYGFVFACNYFSPTLLYMQPVLTLFSYSTTACNLAGAVIVYFFLYESADLTLESVDRVCISIVASHRSY